MWANFKGIYVIITEVPSDYGALMARGVVATLKTSAAPGFNPANIIDTYSAMDETAHAALQIADDFFSHLSVLKVGKAIRGVFFGAFTLVVVGFFYAACAITVIVGKLGLAVAISLAPLAIAMLMMPQTKQYFESWTRFTIGYSVIPLLTTALMAIVLYIAAETRAASGGDPFAFLFVIMAATVLLFQIPTMASNLASASVAAVGAGAVVAAASMAKSATMRLYANARRSQGAATDTGATSKASSGSDTSQAINAMRQSASMRQRHWDERVDR
ncbi:type IV secretion system protein (plasmid) [Bradyrhizobium sp. CCGUVB1N3]|nr:type IV secretion system protein [Bradyrhizobium sp. CCGUVB1N3]